MKTIWANQGSSSRTGKGSLWTYGAIMLQPLASTYSHLCRLSFWKEFSEWWDREQNDFITWRQIMGSQGSSPKRGWRKGNQCDRGRQRHHRTPQTRRTAPPIPEDGSRRNSDRRHSPRLQQHPDGNIGYGHILKMKLEQGSPWWHTQTRYLPQQSAPAEHSHRASLPSAENR